MRCAAGPCVSRPSTSRPILPTFLSRLRAGVAMTEQHSSAAARRRAGARAWRHTLLAAWGAAALVTACAPARPGAGTTDSAAAAAPAPAPTTAPITTAFRDDPFLDSLQRRTFDFFWETTDPRTGLAHDRYPTRSFSSVASVGFALTAYPIGVERGWVTRDQARARVLTTLRFFWRAPQGDAPAGCGPCGSRQKKRSVVSTRSRACSRVTHPRSAPIG